MACPPIEVESQMICIFSTTRDQTTTEVMRWLIHFGAKDVVRVNSDTSAHDDHILDLSVDETAISFRCEGRLIRLSEIEAVWYRKGRHWLCRQFIQPGLEAKTRLSSYLRDRISREQIRLAEYLHYMIERSVSKLGSSSKCDVNKLFVLNEAREVGLLVPPFYISDSKTLLLSRISDGNYITKPITDVFYLFDHGNTQRGYFSYTEPVDRALLEAGPDRLSPSFVQKQIPKMCDVRVYFLQGHCYAMAIFSQSDEQTSVDFRQYNYKRPNRSVPLKLPVDLEEQINTLFARLGLNTGSADFILDRQGNFFFLEINPVGQFSMVSSPCNYLLEREVATTLIENAALHRRCAFEMR